LLKEKALLCYPITQDNGCGNNQPKKILDPSEGLKPFPLRDCFRAHEQRFRPDAQVLKRSAGRGSGQGLEARAGRQTGVRGMTPQLTFDPARHCYFFNGSRVPNVTNVLQAAGLLDYDFLSSEQRELYLARGRAVHLAAQQHDEGSLAEESVSADTLGYLRAWRRFRRDYAFQPLLIEHRVFNPQYRYAGTLDRVGGIRDGTEIIADLKTGIAPHAARFQLAAYAACLPHPRTRRRRCVELHGDGTYRVIGFATSDYLRDFEVFAAALRDFRPNGGER
jgi:hypothetical protein